MYGRTQVLCHLPMGSAALGGSVFPMSAVMSSHPANGVARTTSATASMGVEPQRVRMAGDCDGIRNLWSLSEVPIDCTPHATTEVPGAQRPFEQARSRWWTDASFTVFRCERRRHSAPTARGGPSGYEEVRRRGSIPQTTERVQLCPTTWDRSSIGRRRSFGLLKPAPPRGGLVQHRYRQMYRQVVALGIPGWASAHAWRNRVHDVEAE